MNSRPELFVSASDAEALATVLADLCYSNVAAAGALHDLLVHPLPAKPAVERVPVLSPIGRALAIRILAAEKAS